MSPKSDQHYEVDVRNLFVLVTNRCNLICKHCYVSSGPDGAEGLDVRGLLRLAREFHQIKGRSTLTLSGGEIFARRDVIGCLSEMAALHDIFLLTNATLITRIHASELLDQPIAIRVGLDGATAASHDKMRGTGAFVRAIRGIERVLEAGWNPARIELFFTAVDWNVGEVGELLSVANGLGLSKVHVEPVAVHGRAAEHWPKTQPFGRDAFRKSYGRSLEEAVQRHTGKWRLIDKLEHFQSLTVYSDGRAFPYTTVDAIDETTAYLGNVLSDSLTEILEPSRYWSASMLKMMRYMRGKGDGAEQVRFVRGNVDPGITFH